MKKLTILYADSRT